MMRIGILQCDNVRSTLSNAFGEFPEMIAAGFAALETPENTFTFQTYPAHEARLPECVDECDAYIITGSRYSMFDTEELWINQLRDFIVRLNKAQVKTIGVCFGHQLIAEAMGGKVERADCGWLIGVHTAEITVAKDYMTPATGQIRVPMMCEDQVQVLAEDATVIASGNTCPNMMLQYGEHFLSIQGHPEFSKAFAKAVINVRQDDLPSKRLQKGLESLNQENIDNDLLFQWFANFLLADRAEEQTDDGLSAA